MSSSKYFNEEFFSTILRKFENDLTINIMKYDTSMACEAGKHFTSDVAKVHLSGTRGSLGSEVDYTTSVIVKRIPENKTHVEFYRSDIAHQNEVHAYNEIIPSLSKYTIDRKLPVANCLYSDQNCIILEDLTIQGYSIVHKSEVGFTLKQCEAVIHALGKLHAASIVLGEKEPEHLQKLSSVTKEPLFYGGESQLMRSQKSYIANALNIFKSLDDTNFVQKTAIHILEDLNNDCDDIARNVLLKPRDNSVISHGDAWFGNVMFNEQNEVKLIDLQRMRYNSVAIDLCYLFFVNLEPSLWKENLTRFLSSYLNLVVNNARLEGVNVEHIYTKQFLLNQMSEFAIYGLMRALWVMPAFYYKPEDVDLDNLSLQALTDAKKIAEQTAGEAQKMRIINLVLNYVKIWVDFTDN